MFICAESCELLKTESQVIRKVRVKIITVGKISLSNKKLAERTILNLSLMNCASAYLPSAPRLQEILKNSKVHIEMQLSIALFPIFAACLKQAIVSYSGFGNFM
jgi:hypothetical protein